MHDNDKVEENKNLVLTFQMAVAQQLQGEPQSNLADFLCEDVSWHLPESVDALVQGHIKHGKPEVLSLFDEGVKRFYDPSTMSFDFHGLIAAEDKVHLHFTLSATTSAGKPYSSAYQLLFQVCNNKVKNVWEYFDSALLLQQCS